MLICRSLNKLTNILILYYVDRKKGPMKNLIEKGKVNNSHYDTNIFLSRFLEHSSKKVLFLCALVS